MRTKDHVAVRLDGATLDRLEALRAAMGAKAAELGVLLTQSDALRAAVLAGLDVLEQRHGIRPAKVTLGNTGDGRSRPPGKPRRKR